MKTKKILFYTILIVGLFFIFGCKTPEPTYTVYVDSSSYSDFYKSTSIELRDGYFIKAESNSETKKIFEQMISELPDDCKKEWTEEQINNWFIGRGFGASEANEQTMWILTTDHALIASRKGSTVSMMIK